MRLPYNGGMEKLGYPEFRWWDVEGVPVLTAPLANGGLSCQAFDTDPPRPFRLNSVLNDGVAVDQATFLRLITNPPEPHISDTCRAFDAAH